MGRKEQYRRKKVLSITAIILVCHILLSFLVTKVIYDSIFRRYDHPGSEITDSALTDVMHQISFPSGENTLSGKLFDGPGDSLVVIAQGIHSHSGNYIPIIRQFLEQYNRDVFIFDMTGSCESEGKSGIGFSQAVYDLNAALDHIAQEYAYEDIFLIGHSRGGYAACSVLTSRSDVDAVVTINSPNSPMDAVIGATFHTTGWFAYCNYPILYLYQAMLFDFKTVSQSASDAIDSCSVPVLIIQAQQDQSVIWNRFSIYANQDEISAGSSQFWLIEGDHSSVVYKPSEELLTHIETFFCRYDTPTSKRSS